MFNGIIYKNGSVHSMQKNNKAAQLSIKTNLKFKNSEIGSSICCNGTCLTVTSIKNKFINFYLSKETLKKTNYNYIKIGDVVNLEKSLSYGNKISGHYVQGHVDTIAQVININKLNNNWEVTFKIPNSYTKYLIEKGSIAINGISLTISNIKKNKFVISIIPHTLKLTNLYSLKKDDYVNIEFDIFSKYILNIRN
jgi:riboflavin synthase